MPCTTATITAGSWHSEASCPAVSAPSRLVRIVCAGFRCCKGNHMLRLSSSRLGQSFVFLSGLPSPSRCPVKSFSFFICAPLRSALGLRKKPFPPFHKCCRACRRLPAISASDTAFALAYMCGCRLPFHCGHFRHPSWCIA